MYLKLFVKELCYIAMLRCLFKNKNLSSPSLIQSPSPSTPDPLSNTYPHKLAHRWLIKIESLLMVVTLSEAKRGPRFWFCPEQPSTRICWRARRTVLTSWNTEKRAFSSFKNIVFLFLICNVSHTSLTHTKNQELEFNNLSYLQIICTAI